MMEMIEPFRRDDWDRRVRDTEQQLGLEQGYQLLFCPWATIGRSHIAFLSENPGNASVYTAKRMISDERGNSYEVEREYTLSPLTEQFLKMCDFLNVPPRMMIAGVVNPFRSNRREHLNRQQTDRGLNIGRDFWRAVFIATPVRLVIACGDSPARVTNEIFESRLEKEILSGWGQTKLRRFAADKEVKIIQLPHLSTFKIFSRLECRAPLIEIFEEVE